jgi:ubiquitin C-terminal hydrolase
LFSTLRDLFSVITHQPKQNGVVAPQAFITQLKQENELFRSTMHQDAHEFFNYLMNEISEDVSKREALIAGRNRKRLTYVELMA